MRRQTISLLCAVGFFPLLCCAQQTTASLPNAPAPSGNAAASPVYSPPTQRERFNNYVQHTYGIRTLVEAGVRGGIDQARGNPSQWGGGIEGYADRFGSAAGEIVIRGTTEYLVADLLKEDLRFRACGSSCSQSKFKAAFEDTFMARKGEDGHEALSVARLVAPISGSAVAVNTWYPSGSSSGPEVVRQVGVTFGYIYVRNLIREFAMH